MASLAQMTGSLIDSGCKHIIPVRVSFNFFTRMCKVKQDDMLRNKMKYSMHKGDLVLCVNKNMFKDGDGIYEEGAKMQAYPAVTTTMTYDGHDFDPVLFGLIGNVYAQTASEIFQGDPEPEFLKDLDENNEDYIQQVEQAKKWVRSMPDFRFMGFSLGLAYAHPTSGDNVASSLIGGLLTVRNGPFRMCTGDRVQWIFFFETAMFDDMGHRNSAVEPTESKRRMVGREGARLTNVLKQNGVFDFDQFKTSMQEASGPASTTGKIPLAVIKPYFEGMTPDDTYPRDRMRIIGKAISNAREWENVDIMICTQH